MTAEIVIVVSTKKELDFSTYDIIIHVSHQIRKENIMDLKFGVNDVESHDYDEEGKMVVLKKVDIKHFMEEVFKDERVEEFLSHPDVLEMFAKRIGVKGLLDAFDRTEVCEEITWDFIKDYYLDHVVPEDILDHLGAETCLNHFKDHLESPESINSSDDEQSLLETVDEDEG